MRTFRPSNPPTLAIPSSPWLASIVVPRYYPPPLPTLSGFPPHILPNFYVSRSPTGFSKSPSTPEPIPPPPRPPFPPLSGSEPLYSLFPSPLLQGPCTPPRWYANTVESLKKLVFIRLA